MDASERRVTLRFNVKAPVTFQRAEPFFDGIHEASTMDVSVRGAYFVTSVPIGVGEALEVEFIVPVRVAGTKTQGQRFFGRVTHVETRDMPEGLRGIGVHFLYSERASGAGSAHPSSINAESNSAPQVNRLILSAGHRRSRASMSK